MKTILVFDNNFKAIISVLGADFADIGKFSSTFKPRTTINKT